MVNLRTVGLLVLLLCASLAVAGKPNWAKPGVTFMYIADFSRYYEEDFNVLMQKVNEAVNRFFTGYVPRVYRAVIVFRLVSANDTHGVFQIEFDDQLLEGDIIWSDGVFRVGGKEFPLSIFRPLEKLRGLPQTTVFGLPVYEVVERYVEDSINITGYFYYHKDTGVLVLAIYVNIYRSSDKELRWGSEVTYFMLRGGSVVRGKPQWAAPGVKLVYRTYELNATDIEEALRRAEEEFARGVAAGEEHVLEFVAVDDLKATLRWYPYAHYLYWITGDERYLYWITGDGFYKPPEVLQGYPLVRLGPYETYKVARYGIVAYYQKDTGILLMAVTPAEAGGRFRVFVLASTNISIPTTPSPAAGEGGWRQGVEEGGGTTPSPAAGGPGGLWLVIVVAVAVAAVAVVLLRIRKRL